MNLIIRNENANDYRIVEELTREAFWNIHTPGCDEHFILHNLRNSKDFIPELTFIAQNAEKIVGHVAYSHGIVRDESGAENEIISFGPLSVLPNYQKQGVGSTLVNHTINLARAKGYSAICIYGDPRYYSRFGFRCAEKYEIKTADNKFAVALQVLELKAGALRSISGKFIESHAFEIDVKKFVEFENSFPFKEKTETESQREFRLLVSLRY
jgi:putative acetyltransferase